MLNHLGFTLLETVRDVVPVMVLILAFQFFVLRQPIPRVRQLAAGCVLVFIGLTLFLLGLERALFPLGRLMAEQLSSSEFLFGTTTMPAQVHWSDYGWTYVFAFLVGFSTTVAEPALIAVALKASRISGGTISQMGLRIAVAVGVAVGVTLGVFRIIHGSSIVLFLGGGYVMLVIQTALAPRRIIPLAYDSGGVTTSTVTVPVVAALGLGLAVSIPGRNAAVDGFGLIAFASLFPMMTVMGYAQLVALWARLRRTGKD